MIMLWKLRQVMKSCDNKKLAQDLTLTCQDWTFVCIFYGTIIEQNLFLINVVLCFLIGPDLDIVPVALGIANLLHIFNQC